MEAVRQLLPVVGVLALLAAALWWLKRKGLASFGLSAAAGRASARLASIERLRLSPQHVLHLVRAGDRALVVVLHAAGSTVIDSRPWAEMDGAREPERLASKAMEGGR